MFGGKTTKIKKVILGLVLFVFCFALSTNTAYAGLITLANGTVVEANNLSTEDIESLVTSCTDSDDWHGSYNSDKDGCMLKYASNFRALQSHLISGNNKIVTEEHDDDEESTFGFLTKTTLKPFVLALKYLSLIVQAAVSAGLGLSGMILDSVINITIFEMDSFVSNNQAIETSWEIIRDLINILFIFGLLYISIQTIISGIGPKTRNLLIGIISAALLINFSYLFSTILIDVSNYLTVEVHHKLGECGDGSSISYCFSDNLRLDTAHDSTKDGYAAAALSDSKKDLPDDISELISILTSSLFMLILTFVFLAIAIMLVTRFIVLIFLLITSPVMFLGWVLPHFAGVSKKWFDTLTSNLLFPPLAFLFLLITLTIAGRLDVAIGDGITGSIEIILNFILITGFTVGSLLIAKSLGASGASFATAKAGNIMFGGAAKLGRQTIGRGAANLAGRIKGPSKLATMSRSALKSVGNSSLDVRNTKTFSGVASATGLTKAGLSTGEIQTKGFSQLKEEKRRKLDETRESVGEQTTREKKKESELIKQMTNVDENGNPTHKVGENMKNIKDNKKELEKNRQEISDINNQMRSLDKKSSKYKKLADKHKEVSDRISKNKEVIRNSEEAIKSDPIIKELNDLRKAGKERQKDFIRRQRGLWSWSSTKHEWSHEQEDIARGKDYREEGFEELIKGVK